MLFCKALFSVIILVFGTQNLFAMDFGYLDDQIQDTIFEEPEHDNFDSQSEYDEMQSIELGVPLVRYKMTIKEFPGKTINNIGLLGEERILIELRKKGHTQGKIRAYTKSSLYRQETYHIPDQGTTVLQKKSHRSSRSSGSSKSSKKSRSEEDRKKRHCIKTRDSQRPGTILGGIDERRFISHFSVLENDTSNTKKWFTKVYDIISDKLITQFEGFYRARQIKYYPAHDILVFEISNGIDFFHLKGDLKKMSLGGERRFVALSGNRFASYSGNYELKINSLDVSADAINSSCLAVLASQYVGLTKIVEIDADRIASCSCDGIINIWSLTNYLSLGKMRHPGILNDHTFAVKNLSQNWLASIGSDNSLHIWDLTTFQCLKNITRYQSSKNNWIIDITCLDNRLLLIFLRDSSVNIYDMNSFDLIHAIPQYESFDCYDNKAGIGAVIRVGKSSFVSLGREQSYDSEIAEKIVMYRF